MVLILGIDTSCDETSAALVEDGTTILANIVSSQGIHLDYGGVVPELAARAHLTLLLPAVDAALQKARLRLTDIEGVAVTHGPGLIGSLLIGVSAAKAMAYVLRRPLVGVNHIEGHLFAGFLADPALEPPFVALIVSGGHTQLVHVRDRGAYDVIGRTRDDAAGEAFDKAAKMLGVGYPGGPIIDQLSETGDPAYVAFPRAYLDRASAEFSFSGLKNAVRVYLAGRSPDEVARDLPHIAASFQAAVVDVLVEKTINAARALGLSRVLLTGGVACNRRLRGQMTARAAEDGIGVTCPPPILCTDNGAMIAAAGYFHLSRGEAASLTLTASPRARL
ncbi:MAG: tRNA (adenosine(37)-N6)-threonylcarbamoyltransferase complex transferase subunit TsaD [Candidatus Latescibacteria bacterium]|nr:tRNA (adenosine(37)-N6)-threonylcarbamoyltransferase complex transferase subunit TsaD [Candidatus Latescibacterota bacterium]